MSKAAQPETRTSVSAVALSPDQARTVRQVLLRVVPGAHVMVFGSRSTGKARPVSDLDLRVLQPVSLTRAQRADLRDAFEASSLPFTVDVVEAAGLAPGMAERVAAQMRPLP